MSLADAVVDELARRYSSALMKNPEWDRKAEREAWRSGVEYSVPEYIERPMEDRRRDVCMTTFTASDGMLSLRSLTFAEIGEVVRSVEAK